MNAVALKPVEGSPAANDIAIIVETNPVIVLTDNVRRDELFAHIRAEVDAHVPDLTTEKGRKAIASLAFKVARTKTAIDEAGKKLNEEARAQINVVDASRREIKAELDALRDKARAPLTEWEAAEEARVSRVRTVLDQMQAAATILAEDTPQTLKGRLADIGAVVITADEFQDYEAAARAHLATATTALEAGIARLEKEEADRVELERLRAEAAAREAKAEADRIAAEQKAAAEAAAKARAEAAERAAAEEQARMEAAAKAAEGRAKAAAEAAAREAAQAQERAHAEALAAQKRRADEAEAARKAEADKAVREEAARVAAAKAEADAQAARDANRNHRAKVMGEAKAAIMGHGIGETAARAVVLAIVAGEIPHVSLRF